MLKPYNKKPFGCSNAKLKFMANPQSQEQLQSSQQTQEYVAHLLTEELGKYGFKTLAQSGAQVAVVSMNTSCHYQ